MVFGGPGCAKFDLRPITLALQLTESGRENARGGSRGKRVTGIPCIQGVDKPGPGDIREKRIDTHLGLERSLGVADYAKLPSPRFGGFGIVEKHETPGSEFRICSVSNGNDVGREGYRPRGEGSRGGDLRDDELRTRLGTPDGSDGGSERYGGLRCGGCVRHS